MADTTGDSSTPRRPGALLLLGLSTALVGWNAALNLVPLPAVAYVPANLLLAATLLWIGWRAGLDRRQMGVGSGQGRGVRIGLGVVLLVGAVLLAIAALPAAQPFLTDQRAAGLSGWGLVYAAAVRIPLGTAVPEEVVFRGVLFGLLLRRWAWWPAAAWSSAVFGLWHIGPTIALARVNDLAGSVAVVAGMVAASIGITFVAGLLFCLLRRWGGGVVAPVLAHSATNSLALLTAVAAQAG